MYETTFSITNVHILQHYLSNLFDDIVCLILSVPRRNRLKLMSLHKQQWLGHGHDVRVETGKYCNCS